MAKSVYFPQHGGITPEQTLIQNLVDEQLRLFGAEVFYIPRQMLIDRQLQDVVMSRFKEAYLVEMYLVNVEGFGAQSEFISKFGLRVTDEITFVVSQRRWEDVMAKSLTLTVQARPNEGDLIYYPLTNDFYEIKFVERESPFYQLGKIYYFTMTAEIYEAGNAIFETGNTNLDSIGKDNQNAYEFPVYFKAGGTGNFTIQEEIQQVYTDTAGNTVTVKASVTDWDPVSRQLNLTYINGGDLIEDANIVGQSSGATWEVESFSTIDIDIDHNDFAQNKYLEDFGDNIIDWTEGNPFGEYGNETDSF